MEINYKLINQTDSPITFPWTESLLPEKYQSRLQAYKESPDYVGINEQDATAKKKVPEPIKLKPFFSQLQLGAVVTLYQSGDNGVKTATPEYRWSIGPDPKKFLAATKARIMDICRKNRVFVGKDESKEDILKRVQEIFGSHEQIITERQFIDGGLKNYVIRTIEQRPEPGMPYAKSITKEGFFIAEEVDSEYNPEEATLSKPGPEVEEKEEEKEESYVEAVLRRVAEGKEKDGSVPKEETGLDENAIKAMTVKELVEVARKYGVSYGNKSKAELQTLIIDAAL